MSQSDEIYKRVIGSVESSPNREEEYWDLWVMESRRTFDNATQNLDEIRMLVMDLFKVDLLLASVVYAVFSIKPSPVNTTGVILPGFFFITSLITLTMAYASSQPKTIGASEEFILSSLRDNQSAKDVKIELAARYQGWADQNHDVRKSAQKWIFVSIALIFALLGSTSAVLVWG